MLNHIKQKLGRKTEKEKDHQPRTIDMKPSLTKENVQQWRILSLVQQMLLKGSGFRNRYVDELESANTK